jgi:hypothetical protein
MHETRAQGKTSPDCRWVRFQGPVRFAKESTVCFEHVEPVAMARAQEIAEPA